MANELTKSLDGLDKLESKDTLFLLGGVAMVIFGAGLILSTPVVRRYLNTQGLGNLIQAAVPDFERYLKLRSM